MFSNTFLKFSCLGWVGMDPDIKNAANDTFFVTISVSNSYSMKDSEGNFLNKTDWHKIIFYGRQAEFIAQNVNKGSYVFIEGTIKINKIKSVDGNEKSFLNMSGSSIRLLKKNKTDDRQAVDVELEESFDEKTPF